jgi:hypothetical protein
MIQIKLVGMLIIFYWMKFICVIVNKLFPQNKTKQNKTKQNKTKQNKTKQNKTKQNKTKQNKNSNFQLPSMFTFFNFS